MADLPSDLTTLPVLIGYRGCGKTTIGLALAERLGVAHADTDARVEALAGRTVAEIFAGDGEWAFREMEEHAVAEALGEAAVLSLGGGAVLRRATRDRLAASGRPVVYLAAPADVLAARIAADGDTRPSLTGVDPAAEVAAVLAAREPIYRAAATQVIDATRPVSEVVEALATAT